MNSIKGLVKNLCPDGVPLINLGKMCEIKTGKGITRKDSNDGDFPIISGGKEPMGFFDVFNREENTVTVSRVGANAGFVNFIETKFYLNDKCFSIIPIGEFEEKINPKYLYHALKAKENELIDLQSTGGVPTINTEKVSNISIAVPPLEVQNEIVHILDDFILLSAELSAELKEREKQYEYYRSKLLMFPESLDTLHTHTHGYYLEKVKYLPLEEIAKFSYGYTDKARESGTARFIRITDILDNGYLSNNNAMFVDINKENEKYLLKKGDLVVARTGATYGKTLYYNSEDKAIYASFLIKIELNNEIILNKYYWHFSKSLEYWKQANMFVSKAGQQQFNTNALKKIVVPVPSIERQKEIVELLDVFDSLVNDISDGLPAEIKEREKQYEYYRGKLLAFEKIKVA